MLAMDCSQSFVERGNPAAVVPGECDEIGVGDLAVADHACQLRAFVWDRVGPECMPALGSDGFEDSDCVTGELSFAQQES